MTHIAGTDQIATGFVAQNALEARPPVDPRRSALVVIDMINHQISPDTGLLKSLAGGGIDTTYLRDRTEQVVIPNIARLLSAARRVGMTIAFLRAGGTGTQLCDVVPAGRENLLSWGAQEGTWACQVINELHPQPGELSLLKLGSGGFTTSNLDRHLRNIGIETIFYVGVMTNVCVLLTAASGFDLGYHGYLVSDATATLNPAIQKATEDIVGSFMAQLITTEQAIALL